MTQVDQDCDIERYLTPDPYLSSSDRHEIRQSFDPETQQILKAFGSRLLGLFANNLAEIQLLIALHGRTRSDLVRLETTEGIEHIAKRSPIDEAKLTAQQYLNQIDNKSTNGEIK